MVDSLSFLYLFLSRNHLSFCYIRVRVHDILIYILVVSDVSTFLMRMSNLQFFFSVLVFFYSLPCISYSYFEPSKCIEELPLHLIFSLLLLLLLLSVSFMKRPFIVRHCFFFFLYIQCYYYYCCCHCLFHYNK